MMIPISNYSNKIKGRRLHVLIPKSPCQIRYHQTFSGSLRQEVIPCHEKGMTYIPAIFKTLKFQINCSKSKSNYLIPESCRKW